MCKRKLPEGEEGERHRPFCSKRCAEIDLGRWLTGSYAIPGKPEETEDEDEAGTPKGPPPGRH
jgi:hypothetical protein